MEATWLIPRPPGVAFSLVLFRILVHFPVTVLISPFLLTDFIAWDIEEKTMNSLNFLASYPRCSLIMSKDTNVIHFNPAGFALL